MITHRTLKLYDVTAFHGYIEVDGDLYDVVADVIYRQTDYGKPFLDELHVRRLSILDKNDECKRLDLQFFSKTEPEKYACIERQVEAIAETEMLRSVDSAWVDHYSNW